MTTNLDTYQAQALSTAVFPNDVALPYITLGLVNEVAEMDEAGNLDGPDAFIKEAGDVLWYWAVLLNELGTSPSRLPLADFMAGGLETDSPYITAGKIAGKVKKFLRGDDGPTMSDQRRQEILGLSAELLFSLSVLVSQAGSTLGDVAAKNIEKLARRREADTLKGDGDDR